MADVTFTRTDFDEFTEHLGSSVAGLDKKDQDLLLAFFAAVVDQIEPRDHHTKGVLPAAQIQDYPKNVAGTGNTDAEDLCEKLRHAYDPGKTHGPIPDRITPPPGW